ncbi:MAG: DUF2135 domain-containing protein [Deltaproteobacteria bacterium]|nr:DUF2135 domain-containing protein [Deltaproteobacteria bacterium]
MRSFATLSSCLCLSSTLAAVVTAPAAAQPTEVASVRRPPPVIVIQPDPDKPGQKVGPKTVDIAVRIVGRLAETRMTLTFGNPHGRAMAGDLYLPLPERATVSGYALDVAGRMVDGVVVEKEEARRIFEIEVRKGVDPGLVEWSQGNVFKTRVFPIPANGTRTIMVRWVAPLDDDGSAAHYDLPLAFADPVDLKLRVDVANGKERPIVSGEGPLKLAFSERLVAEAAVTNKPVVQSLRVAIPDVGRRPVQVERGADGDVWFAIQENVPVPAMATTRPKRVRLLWDASLSRDKADKTQELALVKRLVGERFAEADFEIVVVRHEAEPAVGFAAGDVAGVVRFLERLAYDGATQLARLAPGRGSRPVDLQIVFSDGLTTLGDDDPGALGAPTWVVSSTVEAAHDALAHLAKKNGGAYFNLGRVPIDKILSQVGRPVFSLLEARVVAGDVRDLVPAGAEPVVGPSFVAGRLVSPTATIQLAYGLPGQAASITKSYEVDQKAASMGDLVSRAWAERRLSALMASPQKNADAILALGKAHGIVTPGTSLLVLETLDQYVQHRVRPPASLADMRKAWDERIEEETVQRRTTERERLAEVLKMWKREIAWYEQRFEYPPDFRFRGRDDAKMADRPAESGAAFDADERPRPVAAEMARAEPAPEPREASAKKAKNDDGGEEAPPEPGVALSPWNPQTPYVKALEAAAPGGRLAVYLAQRAEHGTAPAFFLDVADFFMAKKDPAMALQVLSNIAELRLEDPALLRILGHRLAQLDHLALAVRVFEEVLRMRGEEPQSYRDLALVLARHARTLKGDAARAAFQRSLELLAEVVKRRWDRFAEIEIMALTEMNRIWPEAKAAGVARFPLDADFEKAMQLDLRIVMTWDADMTDMDLHVLEPSGEEAYYSHNLTTIGGRVSRDFTQGYGPEVYSIRKAMRGTYKVKTKFYGSSAAQLQGAVTLQVDVFTNWGRANEKRQSMTLRLTERKEDFVVGEIEF